MPDPNDPRPRDDSATWPFVVPMIVFLALVFVGGLQERWHAAAYVARTLIVGGLLALLWPRLRRDVQWAHTGLGVAVGIIGVVQWIGTDKLLQLVRSRYPDDWILGGVWSLVVSGVRPGEGYNPVVELLEPAGVWPFVGFVLVRTLGPILVVPIMEELFWRDWLWRSFISPNNWRLAALGEPDRAAVVLTCLAFALVHPQRLVSVIWAALIAWLLIRTRSLGACIVAHAVTNALLAGYVLVAALAYGRASEWYFW